MASGFSDASDEPTFAVVRGSRDRAGLPVVRELRREHAEAAVRDRRSRPGATGRADWRVIPDDELTEQTRGADTLDGTTRVAKRRERRKRAADRARKRS